jgi:hypothetical protein
MNFEIAPKSSEIKATWDEASLYCFALEIDGKVGWRLPSNAELELMHTTDNDFVVSWYWSATEDSAYDAIGYNFSSGISRNHCKNSNRFNVRTIRPVVD